MAQSTYNYNNQYVPNKPAKAKKNAPQDPIAPSNEQKLLEYLEQSSYSQSLKHKLFQANILAASQGKAAQKPVNRKG